MKIWRIRPAGKITALTTDDLEVIRDHFRGRPMSESWKPIHLETYKKGTNVEYYQFGSGIPVLSKNITEILEPHLKNWVEFLPAIHDNHELYMINVLLAENMVDLNKSTAERSVKGTIIGFNEIFFFSEKIIHHPIFKVLEKNTADIYVNENFVRLITDSKIKGFEFQEVWDSGVTEDMHILKQEKYESLLAEIESYRGITYKWEEAVRLTGSGKALRSAAWKIQKDTKGQLQILILKDDCQYHLLNTDYIPPRNVVCRVARNCKNHYY